MNLFPLLLSLSRKIRLDVSSKRYSTFITKSNKPRDTVANQTFSSRGDSHENVCENEGAFIPMILSLSAHLCFQITRTFCSLASKFIET